MCFCSLIFILSISSGIALFIAGRLLAMNSRTNGFPLLVGIGFGLFGLRMLVLLFGCCIIQSRRTTRMRKAIAQESMKYTMRSPMPCSWGLDIQRNWVG